MRISDWSSDVCSSDLGEDGRDELAELEERTKSTKLSKEASEKALGELKKLRSMSPMSAEAPVVRNYLDWILSIPWKKRSKIKRDIKQAQEIIDAAPYGPEQRSEERRVGKECVGTCRSRWCPYT